VFGREVKLETFSNDKYGCTLADVLLPDGTHVNRTLVKNGWCWWYRKYAPKNTELASLEQHAGEAKKGLCGVPVQVSPREWRKMKVSRRIS